MSLKNIFKNIFGNNQKRLDSVEDGIGVLEKRIEELESIIKNDLNDMISDSVMMGKSLDRISKHLK